MSLYLGVDVGTSSTKGVIADGRGAILASSKREHQVEHPRAGWAQMDAHIWWEEFCSISAELVAQVDRPITAVGVSGMGPCVVVADEDAEPLRAGILYGVDTRATQEIAELNQILGKEEILRRCGSLLSTQAVGPKLRWLEKNEPENFARARYLFMPASWLAYQLTGAYVLDHQSASQAAPLYDSEACDWYAPWVHQIAPQITLPRLGWSNDLAGNVSKKASSLTGIPEGVPVTFGTIDAWSEAVSVDGHNVGDLMLMYGTTMFFVHTLTERILHPALWSVVGALAGTRSLAAGMATSGAITNWLRDLCGRPEFDVLLEEAEESGVGARGLLLLPYFSGERTPIADPAARGVIAGLTTSHIRGDLYRAALEATAYGVRHNLDAFREAGADVRRIVAVGGGVSGGLWARIVSDVTGVEQVVARHTIGAAYGAAMLAAMIENSDLLPSMWNPPQTIIKPDRRNFDLYSRYYEEYLKLYPCTRDIQHFLSEQQRIKGV